MRRNIHPWGALAAVLLTPLASAAPPLSPFAAADPVVGVAVAAEDTIESILDEYDEAYSEYRKASKEAKTDEERREVSKLYPRADQYAERLLRLAKAAPETEEALEAFTWIFQRRAAGDRMQECLDLVLMHHRDGEDAGQFCLNLSYNNEPEVQAFLTSMKDTSTNTEVRGKATYALAGVLGRQEGLARKLKEGDEETIKQYRGYYSDQIVDLALQADVLALGAERESLLVIAQAQYADIQLRGRTLGEAAKADLFELRNLQVGKVAPDIVGEDLDGVEFKLSDYRGKVVFLDFWGHW